MLLRKIIILFVCFPLLTLQAQKILDSKISRKSYEAQRISTSPTIDGILDENI
jgi:hypothetical protein